MSTVQFANKEVIEERPCELRHSNGMGKSAQQKRLARMRLHAVTCLHQTSMKIERSESKVLKMRRARLSDGVRLTGKSASILTPRKSGGSCDAVKELPRASNEIGRLEQQKRLARMRSITIKRIHQYNNEIQRSESKVLKMRRARLSDDVRLLRNRALVLTSKKSDRAREDVEASQFVRFELLKEKCNISRSLRALYNVFCLCISNPEKNFRVFNTQTGYDIQTTKKKLVPESVNGILKIIRRAVDLDVKGVFTDHGRWISMTDFLEKIKTLAGQNDNFARLMDGRNYDLLEKTVMHFAKSGKYTCSRKSLKNLKLPDFAKKLPKKEQVVVRLLQRIYPGGSQTKGYIDPLTLILVYPRYVTTQRFFALIKLLLEESEKKVPTIQKHRLMNLCRTWVSRKYHPDQIQMEDVIACIKGIVNMGMLASDSLLNELAHELSTCLISAPLHVKENRLLSGELELSRMFERLNKGNFDECVEMVASDCFDISRSSTLNIPLHEFFFPSNQTVFMKKLVERFERLSNLVKVSILQPVSQYGVENPMQKVYQRIHFWIEVADFLLKERGDFSFGLAIVSGISNPAISRLCVNEKGTDIRRSEKNLLKKVQKKINALNAMLSPNRDFQRIREEIKSRHHVGKPSIPYIGLFSRYLIHTNDGNKEEIDGVINVQKLHIIANILSNYWKNLTRLRSNTKRGRTIVHQHTDLLERLEKTVVRDEEQLWKLSEKIKPHKTT